MLLFASGSASAAPLDGAVCDGMKAEKQKAVATGLPADIERGPDWAKTNLSPERLKEIEHFIELDEQIAFRCPRPKPVAPPATTTASTGDPAVPGKKKSKIKSSAAASGEDAEAGVPGVVPVKPHKEKRKAVQIIVKKPVGAGADTVKAKAVETPAKSGSSKKATAPAAAETANKPAAAAAAPTEPKAGAAEASAPAPSPAPAAN